MSVNEYYIHYAKKEKLNKINIKLIKHKFNQPNQSKLLKKKNKNSCKYFVMVDTAHYKTEFPCHKMLKYKAIGKGA